MARLLTLVLGFTAVVQLNAASKEAILKPSENVDLQCSDSKVIVPEYVRYQNKAPGGEDCVLDKARVSIIKSCFNKEMCSASAMIANDCDRGSEDIVVKYECVSRSKIVTACSNTREVTGDFPPFYWISPNYPQSYNGGDDCEIKVNSASNAMYKVEFLDMEFEARAERSTGCYDKVVIINEQTEAYTYEYCGSMTNVKTGEDLVKLMEHLKMKIITDNQQHMRGMLIKVGETSTAETTTTTTTTTTVSTTTRPEPVKTSSTKETTQSTKRPDTATAATPKSTMRSTTGESVTLPSFDNCASSPCKNNGTCVDEFGFFFCTCELGFSGYNCEIVLNATLDQCEYKPCRHGGTCVDDYQTFRCICRTGYSGTRCEELVDIGHRTSSASRPVTFSAVLVLLILTVLSHLSS